MEPTAEHDGHATSPWQRTPFLCPHCYQFEVRCRFWMPAGEAAAETIAYHCWCCDRRWWLDDLLP
jgi:hypothetical protein